MIHILELGEISMWIQLFAAVVILVSIAVGVLALTLPREAVIQVIVFRDFFDTTLPILGFGALVKYLCTFHCDSCGKNKHK